MSGFPTHGFCEGNVAFHVLEGEREGVNLSGAKVAIGVAWPGAIHEGNGKAAVFIDGGEEQQQALVPILTAEDPGLPWEILAATLTEVYGPFFEPIEIDDNGTDSRIRVGDKLDITMQSFTNPVTGEKHEAHTVLPTGFIFKDGLLATTSANRVSADGISFDHAGNNAYYSEVEWSSENRMAPASTAGRFS
jgi:hypothetical protein